ncbi:FHA domain-containing protein [Antrihabitans spumae]|uniref:FHA domain-containing protein n=1 Tax=Antrihabitans spumae TaxID=3373370 RepID=A0ABW7KJV0_9NOCA
MSTGQVEIVPGRHLVASTAGVVVVVAHRDSSALTAGSSAAQTWQALHDLVQQAASMDARKPGRAFARLATRWVVDQDDDVEFGVLSPAGNGLAVFLHGGVTAVIGTGSGEQETIRGNDAAFTVDRIVDAPTIAGLFVDESGTPPTLPVERGISALTEGVAPGVGAVLWLTEPTTETKRPPGLLKRILRPDPADDLPDTAMMSKVDALADDDLPSTAMMPKFDPFADDDDDVDDTEDTADPQDDHDHAHGHGHVHPEPATVPRLPSAPEPGLAETVVPARVNALLKPPALSARIDITDEPEPRRQPLPDGSTSRRDRSREQTELGVVGVKVRGFKCARAHLNDPRVAFCRVCGLRMDQLTGILTEDTRPPLGLLVVDDGTTFILDGDCVLGREPETSDAARAGFTPIRLSDSSGGMSRAHAEFRLIEWDVAIVDRGSTNGTHVRVAGALDWHRLPPRQPFLLTPGSEVMIGGRTVTFDSPHGQL